MKTLTLLSLITLIFSAVQKGKAYRRSTLYILQMIYYQKYI